MAAADLALGGMHPLRTPPVEGSKVSHQPLRVAPREPFERGGQSISKALS